MTTITVKIDGLDALRKVIDNLDTEKIVKEAIRKAMEPELKEKPCPFCGNIPVYAPAYGTVICQGNDCPLEGTPVMRKAWNRRV